MSKRVMLGSFRYGNARATVFASGDSVLSLSVEVTHVEDVGDGLEEWSFAFTPNDLPDMERAVLRVQLWFAEVGSLLLDGRNENGLPREKDETSRH